MLQFSFRLQQSKTMGTSENSFYVTGGTLRPDAPCYVERQADKDLYDGLLKSEFCYVLTSRQMGKSSLMARTARKLREQKVRIALLDLTAIGQNLTPEQWYGGLTANLGRQLGLEDELDTYWLNEVRLSPVQRFFSAIREVGMRQHPGRMVIFVDEIDTVRSLPFSTDEFFAAIRECYNRRTEDPNLNQLAFCLLGVATPSDLVRDSRATPLNIARRIELNDFTGEEAAPLAKGFGLGEERAQELLDRILHWTNGHPYLTQRLCRATAEANTSEHPPKPRIANRRSIDRVCEDLFLSNRARERDDNLLFVRECLLRSDADLAGLLELYDRVRNFAVVHDDETHLLIKALRLSGITRVEKSLLRVRNRIYERVFDHDWVMANVPVIRHPGTRAIAVMPFHDDSVDPLNDYWTDGLTEELINALGQVPGLTVASRSSAFEFKGKTENLNEIASRLNVEIALEGTVRRMGDRVRISVELVSVTDGYRLWAETFNYRAKDLFAIQDEITGAIVARLKFGLRSQSDAYATKPPTDSPEAYNLYLKARYDWNKRHEAAVRRSIRFFDEAIHKDPHFALAYAGLADAYNLLGIYNYLPPVEAYPKAKAAGLKALEIDDKLAQAHATLGCVYSIYDWNWARAEAEFKRSIQLNPSYVPARQWYAINCLTPLARHEEAINELRKAQAVDPLSLGVQASLALTFYYARQYERAIGQCRLTLDMEEDFWVTHLFLGWAYLQRSMFAEAIAACQCAAQRGKNDPVALASLAYAHALAGNRGEALRLADDLTALTQERYVPASEIAILWLGLGDAERAMQWLLKASEEKSLRQIYLKVEPRLDGLRKDPRFSEMLAKVGFSDSKEARST